MSTEKGKLKQCDVMDTSYCVEVQIISSPKAGKGVWQKEHSFSADSTMFSGIPLIISPWHFLK